MKRNLLFAALCALGAWVNTYAVDWTDKTSVINNPSFETDNAVSDATTNALNSATVTGWTVLPTTTVSNAQAAVVNSSSTLSVLSGSDGATTGSKYFYVRQNWNNTGNFGIQQVIPANDLPAGLYMLTCKIKTSSSNPGSSSWTLSIQEGDKTAVTNTNAGSAAEWLNYGVLLYKESAETAITISAYMVAGASGGSQHYAMLLDDFQLKYISAENYSMVDAKHAVDMSGVIYNEGIYNATKTALPRGWQEYGRSGGNGNYTEGTGNTQLEGWEADTKGFSRDYYQTINNLPDGKYTVTAKCHDTNSRGAYLYIFSNDVRQSKTMTSDYSVITTPAVDVSNGSINIGIKLDNKNGTWMTGDDFRLTYQGTELSAAKRNWYDVLQQAQDLYNQLSIAAINTAITENSSPENTIAAYNTAATNLQNAISGALSNGTDLTSVIKNAAVTSTDNWDNGRINSGQQYTGAPDNTYMDTWNSTLDQAQSLNLPAGYYLLKAATRADASASGNIYAWANGSNLGSTEIHKEGSAGNLLGNGWAWTRVPFHVESASTVKVGFWSNCNNNKWAGADNFTLAYYTTENDLNAAMLTETKADATAWKTKLTDNIPTAGLTALQTAIDNSEATVSSVETAISNARALVDNYATYKAAKANMDAILAVAVTDNTEKASRRVALDAIPTAVEAATDAATIATETAKINPAILTYIKKLTPADAENAPFDLTFMITNPSFSANSMDGWTGTPPNFGNDATQKAAYACEYYQKEFDINQTLTGMVTGNYRLKVKAYQRPGASNTVVTDYVNAADKAEGTFGTTSEIYVDGGNEASQKIKNAASPMITAAVGTGSESSVEVSGTTYYIPNDMVSAVAYFNAGHYENVANITATTTSVKFGFRSTANHVSYDWTIFDDFRLYYTGQLDLTTFKASLATKVAEANALKTSLDGSIPAAALAALQTAIDNNDNDNDAFENEEDFTTAISNIQSAMDAANALVTPYLAYTNLHASGQAMYDVSKYEELVSGAHEGLGSALTTAATNIVDATTLESINSITSTLKAACITYVNNANPVDDAQFDITFMVTNPNLDSFDAGTEMSGVDGWYSDQPDGNRQVQKNEGVGCAEGYAFFEYWSKTAKDNGEFALYNKTDNLPVGTYTINCYALATANGVEGATTSAVYFYANDTQGSLVSADVLTASTISFVNTTQQDVKIGLKPLAGNQFRWMAIGYVKLYKVPAAAPVVLDESETYDFTYEGAATAKLTRAIYAGFNTVMLPFSLSASEITTVFGEGTLYGFTGADGGSLDFATSESLLPNTPYLFKADADKTLNAVEIEARTFVAASAALCSTAGEDYNLVGTYTPYAKNADSNPIVAGRDYVLGADNNFHKTTVKNALKAFRAYIQANEDTPSGDVKLMINIDGEETAISSIDGENVQRTEIYNLAGQRMSKVQRGVNIVNGKKVLVK